MVVRSGEIDVFGPGTDFGAFFALSRGRHAARAVVASVRNLAYRFVALDSGYVLVPLMRSSETEPAFFLFRFFADSDPRIAGPGVNVETGEI